VPTFSRALVVLPAFRSGLSRGMRTTRDDAVLCRRLAAFSRTMAPSVLLHRHPYRPASTLAARARRFLRLFPLLVLRWWMTNARRYHLAHCRYLLLFHLGAWRGGPKAFYYNGITGLPTGVVAGLRRTFPVCLATFDSANRISAFVGMREKAGRRNEEA